jgi:hypothetical protein
VNSQRRSTRPEHEHHDYGQQHMPLTRSSLRLRDERIEREWKAWKMLHDWI